MADTIFAQKLLEAAAALELNISKMQVSTGKLSHVAPVGTGNRFEYFKNIIPGTAATNLTSNKLEANTLFMIKEIGINAVISGGADTVNAAPVAIVNLYVGNQRIVKDYPLIPNPDVNSDPFYKVKLVNTAPPGEDPVFAVSGPVSERLLTATIIPPQTEFWADVQTMNGGNLANVEFVLKGLKTLQSFRINY
jgi:hypothetical protein